jgi:hypothetical protein
MTVRFSAFPAGRPLLPGRFLALISVRGGIDLRAIIRLEEFGQFKKIQLNKTHDLPACSIMLQPTALPRLLYQLRIEFAEAVFRMQLLVVLVDCWCPML